MCLAKKIIPIIVKKINKVKKIIIASIIPALVLFQDGYYYSQNYSGIMFTGLIRAEHRAIIIIRTTK